ncbi:MAG: hypothetical protein HY928_08975 [Elusimicrobia bacterium]|nr:hypothetical protein [Elusimicrobiota bacterium]
MHRAAPLLVLLLAASCKPSKPPTPRAQAPDGWKVYEDARLSVELPPGMSVAVTAHSENDASPEFTMDPAETGRSGRATFVLDEASAGMLPRDAAGAMIGKFLADGARPLAEIRPLSMKTGSCAVFAAASGGQGCVKTAGNRCHQFYWLAQCDVPGGKRYLYIGDLGASDRADLPPPEFRINAANHERTLRSVEFKKT